MMCGGDGLKSVPELLTISFFILPNALLRVTVVSQRAEMSQGAVMGLSNSVRGSP